MFFSKKKNVSFVQRYNLSLRFFQVPHDDHKINYFIPLTFYHSIKNRTFVFTENSIDVLKGTFEAAQTCWQRRKPPSPQHLGDWPFKGRPPTPRFSQFIREDEG